MNKTSEKNPPLILQEIIIGPPSGIYAVRLSEIWAYRELLIQLVRRDLIVRYKQSMLGFWWALLNPVLMTLVFTVIFGIWARMPSNGVPYPAFFLAGIIPWTFFASALNSISDSMVRQSALLTKVYFPRIIVPLAATAVALADYLLAVIVLLVVVIASGLTPRTETIMILPVVTLWLWAASLAIGLWFAAFNVRYRDTAQIVPFAIRIGMFASPVIYPVGIIPEHWRWLYGLNPVVGAIEWLRWTLFDTGSYPAAVYFLSVLFFLPILIGGTRIFRKMEDTYADTV